VHSGASSDYKFKKTMASTGLFADFAGEKTLHSDGIKYADYQWLYNNGRPGSDIILAEVGNSKKKIQITHNGQTKNIGFRDNLRFQGFHIGMHSDMAISPDDLDDTSTYQYYDHAWDFIVELKDKDKAKWGAFSSLEKATRILKGYDKANTSSVLLYPLDQLDPVEFLNPDSYTGSIFWAQDLEADSTLNPSNKTDYTKIKKQFAGIVAVLWAGRQFLGDKFPIIPNVSKSIITNLRNNVGDELVNLDDVHDLVAPLLTDNNQPTLVNNFSSRPTYGEHKRNSWSLMSYLKMNGLIDGFVSQETRGKVLSPGDRLSLNSYAAPFSLDSGCDVPYALQGYWNGPQGMPQKPSLSKKITIDYHGNMLLDSSMYFVGDAQQNSLMSLLPDQYYSPLSQPLIAINASQYQFLDDGGFRVVDLRTLSDAREVQISIALSREADYQSHSGFYRVQGPEGSVRDPITGEMIYPGHFGYKAAALASQNRVDNLSNISLSQNGNDLLSTSLDGGFLMAPFAEITEPGKENTFFSYAAANTDGISHFKQISANSFGMEDMYGGGDNDFNDLVISFHFLEIS